MKTLTLAVCAVFFGTLPHSVGGLRGASRDQAWRPPLEVEHDIPSRARVRAGDSLVIHLALQNISDAPVTFDYGSRLFVVERTTMSGNTFMPAQPPHQSWGLVSKMEFPNPGAAYTAIGHRKTLLPGERFTPALVYGRDAYHVPFDSVGTYGLVLCAYVASVRLCNLRRGSLIEVYK